LRDHSRRLALHAQLPARGGTRNGVERRVKHNGLLAATYTCPTLADCRSSYQFPPNQPAGACYAYGVAEMAANVLRGGYG
jgi:hypothetical protein